MRQGPGFDTAMGSIRGPKALGRLRRGCPLCDRLRSTSTRKCKRPWVPFAGAACGVVLCTLPKAYDSDLALCRRTRKAAATGVTSMFAGVPHEHTPA